jgi:hypothetical protein
VADKDDKSEDEDDSSEETDELLKSIGNGSESKQPTVGLLSA